LLEWNDHIHSKGFRIIHATNTLAPSSTPIRWSAS
jgi:hypothetical protein